MQPYLSSSLSPKEKESVRDLRNGRLDSHKLVCDISDARTHPRTFKAQGWLAKNIVWTMRCGRFRGDAPCWSCPKLSAYDNTEKFDGRRRDVCVLLGASRSSLPVWKLHVVAVWKLCIMRLTIDVDRCTGRFVSAGNHCPTGYTSSFAVLHASPCFSVSV